MSPNQPPRRPTPSDLREKAQRCYFLAAEISPGVDADTLRAFGDDYLQGAETLERLLGDADTKTRPVI